jgi:hypothetical protein
MCETGPLCLTRTHSVNSRTCLPSSPGILIAHAFVVMASARRAAWGEACSLVFSDLGGDGGEWHALLGSALWRGVSSDGSHTSPDMTVGESDDSSRTGDSESDTQRDFAYAEWCSGLVRLAAFPRQQHQVCARASASVCVYLLLRFPSCYNVRKCGWVRWFRAHFCVAFG